MVLEDVVDRIVHAFSLAGRDLRRYGRRWRLRLGDSGGGLGRTLRLLDRPASAPRRGTAGARPPISGAERPPKELASTARTRRAVGSARW